MMEKAKNRKNEVLLFLDASHFVMGSDFLGSIYSKSRRFVKTFSGRQRFNVLGALDFVTKKVWTVTNSTYITSREICEMFRVLRENYPGKRIHLALDNARYQKCALVAEAAAKYHIGLVYIPPYSPNLNLIERLWKFVKSELRDKYYEDFSLFCSTIENIIGGTTGTYSRKVNQLIGEKVQFYDDLKPTKNKFVWFSSRRKLAA